MRKTKNFLIGLLCLVSGFISIALLSDVILFIRFIDSKNSL